MLKEEKAQDILVNEFNNAMDEIKSLTEFYRTSKKSITQYEREIKTKYEYGLLLCKFFGEIINAKNEEDKNLKIEEINKKTLFADKTVKDVCEIFPVDGDIDTLKYRIKDKYRDIINPVKAKKTLNIKKQYEKILISSVLSNIIIIFEKYLSNIYHILIIRNPKKYLQNQTIKLAEIFDQNVKEVFDEKIQQEIDSKMFDSLKAIDILTKEENIIIDKTEPILKDFQEIHYRRNSYVHSEGKAVKRYLKNVDQKFKENIKENDFLYCDEKYINNSINLLIKIIFSFTLGMLTKSKINEDNLTKISNYFFERLSSKEYELAKFGYLSLYNLKEVEMKDKTMFLINYLNALKQLKKTDEFNEKIKKLDVSMATDDFKIAKECLLDNNKKVFELLKDTYPKSFDAVCIREWPIFINFRKTEFYQEFVNLHKLDFETQQLEKNEKNNQEETC